MDGIGKLLTLPKRNSKFRHETRLSCELAAIMRFVRVALERLYTFGVTAALIAIPGRPGCCDINQHVSGNLWRLSNFAQTFKP